MPPDGYKRARHHDLLDDVERLLRRRTSARNGPRPADAMRRDEAASFMERLASTPLKPSVVAMVGVCAGNPNFVQLGDLLQL